jgi:DNA helicase HerA-like ATPase
MGRYGDDLRAYTFIANIISMKIWNTAVNRIMKGEELKYKIIIFLEEAHKFLSPEKYYKNPFGDIARELRKRGILLCIIDQRPSQIAEDVIAMLWNNFVFSLTEAKDITSVTRNLKFSSLFESVISNLKRREALIFGEMIKIPAVVTIVDYKEMVKYLKRVYENQKTLVEIPGY